MIKRKNNRIPEIMLIIVLLILFIAGCTPEKQGGNEVQKKKTLPELLQRDLEGATKLLSTDSCGCRVYEIERDHCWVYVNNNGGIYTFMLYQRIK